MSTKPHYFALGLFVLAAVGLALVGLVVVSADALNAPKHFLETYVDESIQGVEVGTPFKFRGVQVGNVSEIAVVSAKYDTPKMYIMVRVALRDRGMLKDKDDLSKRIAEQVEKGLRIKLVPQGITGLSFLEADYYEDSMLPPLEVDWEPEFSYVPSKPSTMKLLVHTAEHLMNSLSTLDIEQFGKNVEHLTENLYLTLEHIEVLTGNSAKASEEIIQNVHEASVGLPVVVTNLNETVLEFRDLVQDSEYDVDQVLSNIRYITDDMRELIRMIKRHPGMLLSEAPDKDLSRGGK